MENVKLFSFLSAVVEALGKHLTQELVNVRRRPGRQPWASTGGPRATRLGGANCCPSASMEIRSSIIGSLVGDEENTRRHGEP